MMSWSFFGLNGLVIRLLIAAGALVACGVVFGIVAVVRMVAARVLADTAGVDGRHRRYGDGR